MNSLFNSVVWKRWTGFYGLVITAKDREEGTAANIGTEKLSHLDLQPPSPLHPLSLEKSWPHCAMVWISTFSGSLQVRFSSAWRAAVGHTGLINFSCLNNYSPEVTMKAKRINLCSTEILISHGALTKKKKKHQKQSCPLNNKQQKLLNFHAGQRKNSSQNLFWFLVLALSVSCYSHAHPMQLIQILAKTTSKLSL